MALVLSLSLPVLQPGEQPVSFSLPEVADTRPSWTASVALAPRGLAFCQRIELMQSLRGEDDRSQRCHADPNAAAQWNMNDDGQSSSGEDEADNAQADARQHTSSRKKKFTKINDDELLIDWYDMLKLENGDSATDDQIKVAYRKRCLETHPDKQRDHSDELFKKVQRAFEILGDPDVRQSYDSSRPFDDAIPGEAPVAEAAFYSTFGPVFERNRKWSCERDLPSLGTDKTPYKEVMRFYDRWSGYQSWRDFSHLADLEEIDDGMCREEKRYYMRENERQLAQHHKQEIKRIRTLIERARKSDPRLRRKREMDEAKRLKEQTDREAFRQQIRDEEDRRRAEEEARERQKKEDAAKAVLDARNAMRQTQQAVMEYFATHALLDETATNKLLDDAVRRPNITWLFGKITTPEEAAAVLASVQAASTNKNDAGEVEAVTVFNKLIEHKERQTGLNRYGEAIKKAPVGGSAAEEKKNSEAGGNAASARQPAPEWTDDDLQRLQKATAKYPPGTIERWSKIAVAIRNRFSEEQCMTKVNELTAALHAGTTLAGSPTTSSPSPSSPVVNGPSSPAAAAAAVSVDDWTMKQQKQLEQGLRDLKDYKDKDKFQKISKMVDGKTAKECFDRFKYLCTMNKKK